MKTLKMTRRILGGWIARDFLARVWATCCESQITCALCLPRAIKVKRERHAATTSKNQAKIRDNGENMSMAMRGVVAQETLLVGRRFIAAAGKGSGDVGDGPTFSRVLNRHVAAF